jgi:hypothetical protein
MQGVVVSRANKAFCKVGGEARLCDFVTSAGFLFQIQFDRGPRVLNTLCTNLLFRKER